MMNHRILISLIALTLAAMLTATSLAGTITLRSAVRLPADATQVRLADIADITGDAERFGHTIIAELHDPTAAVEISLRQVREKLEETDVHWGRVSLTGRSVTVRPRRTGAAAPPIAMSGAKVHGASARHRESDHDRPRNQLASELIAGRTLRSAIARFMAAGLNVAPSDLQLSFDERHASILDADPGERRFEVEPVSNLRSSRVDLTVRIWIDGLIDHRHTFSVSPLIRTPVVVVNQEMRRDEVIDEARLKIEHRWMSPNNTGVVQQFSQVSGRHAHVRLREGELLRESHLRRETLIRRGEQVIVRCIVGSAVISLQAEARADGSEGDTIEFRKLGERDTFLAVVTGRNEAIVDLSNR